MGAIRELERDLRNWAVAAKDELGYVEKFRLRWNIFESREGLLVYSLEILEDEESHILTGACGSSVEMAVGEVYLNLPDAFKSWGWPTDFPVEGS